MEIGMVRKVDIDQEMQQSYLDYAMSVIVSRALPDARDGLKPVQRRILYAMYDMGLRPTSDYKKSARIVGEVLGKYHPHGDMAVYEAMARLAQDFTMRSALVDGQGNFGSVDGDPPAAMRYTEARLAPFAIEILNQLDRNTVDFSPNFDGTLKEPDVLPAAVPNLLVNGASGIAVGMATNIPPHNLGEVVDAMVVLLRNWDKVDDISVTDLMKYVQGPDFPTGGIILEEHGENEILAAYATGRGRVIVRGRVHAEEMSRGRMRLIITELPYQVNKSALIERIAELVREETLEGIADLRDESDRHGMRIVIELRQGVEPDTVVSGLYRKTPLEITFGINMLALVNGEPHLLSLKHALKVYLEHRLDIVRRRSEYDLDKARQRLHILEGLRVALKNLDEIIALIKSAADAEEARDKLMKRYKLSEIQAQAILDMQLRRLAALERKKIELEYKELEELIKELTALLKSPAKMRQVVESELLAMKEAYADKRRTQIVSLKEGESSTALLMTTDITPAQAVWVGVTADGLIARTAEDALPRVSGRAAPRWLLRTTTHHTLYLAAEDGRTAAVAASSIPEADVFANGLPLAKVAMFEDNDRLAAMFSVPPKYEIKEDQFVLAVTRQGLVKKSALSDLPGPSAQRFTLIKINPGDALVSALFAGGEDEILLLTAQGMAIRFSGQDVRPMGLVAAGVNGIKLAAADAVIAAEKFTPGGEILLVANNGKGWRLALSEFPLQGRYGQGVQVGKLPAGSRLAACLAGKKNQTGLLHFKLAAARSIRVDEVSLARRWKVPQDVVALKPGDSVEAITRLVDDLGRGEEKPRGGPKTALPEEELPQIVIDEEKQLVLAPFVEEIPPVAPAAEIKPAPQPAQEKSDGHKPKARVAPAKRARKAQAQKPAKAAEGSKKAVRKTAAARAPEKAVKKSASAQAGEQAAAKTTGTALPKAAAPISAGRGRKPAAVASSTEQKPAVEKPAVRTRKLAPAVGPVPVSVAKAAPKTVTAPPKAPAPAVKRSPKSTSPAPETPVGAAAGQPIPPVKRDRKVLSQAPAVPAPQVKRGQKPAVTTPAAPPSKAAQKPVAGKKGRMPASQPAEKPSAAPKPVSKSGAASKPGKESKQNIASPQKKGGPKKPPGQEPLF